MYYLFKNKRMFPLIVYLLFFKQSRIPGQEQTIVGPGERAILKYDTNRLRYRHFPYEMMLLLYGNHKLYHHICTKR